MKYLKVAEIMGRGRKCALSALMLLAILAPCAQAALKYDVGGYVQDGLVLHLDGIRNVGANAPHDANATAWANLVAGPGFVLKTQTSSAGTMGTPGWTDNGFSFANAAYFLGTGFASGWATNITIEMTGNFPNVGRHADYPNYFCNVDGSEFNIWNPSGNGKGGLTFKDDAADTGSNNRPTVSSWDGVNFSCFMSDTQKGIYVKGVAASTKNRTNKKAIPGTSYYIGDTPAKMTRTINGTMNAFRIYNRALSAEEIAANWQLDQYRFITGIPVTNAVIATSVDGATGPEGTGVFAVDEDGYTFRAPACATVGGVAYALSGCTVASWDDATGNWGAAETRDGVFAVSVSSSDKVKITWQWEAATGSLDAGYVTDGLALRLDGIDNAGVGVHDASAAVWKDLSGNGRDATLFGNADGTSHWTDKGFYFNFNAVFSTAEKFAFGTQHTFEILMDGKRSDWWGDNQEKDIIVPSTGPTGAGGIYYKAANEILCHRSDATTGSAWNAMPGFYRLNTVTYVAALRDNAKTALITGTTYPETEYDIANGGIAASQNFVTNAWLVGSKNLVADPTTWLVGGRTTAPANTTKGTVKSVRLYNRLLTEEELAHNRAIDEARFFGKIPETGCVVVQSAIAGLEGRESSGTYFPDGWTFSAGAGTQTVRGIKWQCAGYQLQTWDAATSTWGAQQTVLRNGENAVEYTAAATSAALPSVRLTWLWKPVSGIRTAADYVLADYVVGGLQLHLDGLLNTGAAHDSSATVWSDLSGNGRDATLAGNPSGESHWVDDGYFFASNAVFATGAAATFSLGHAYTMQTLGDVNFADNKDGSHNGTYVSPIDHIAYGSIWLKGDGMGTVQHHTSDMTGAAWNLRGSVFVGLDGHPTYLTAIRNGNRAALVEGTVYPTTENTMAHQACMDWSVGSKDASAPATRWGVGALTGGGGGDPLYGTIKSVRLYDRMLTEDELAWNRNVDSARYFGELGVTNVLVRTEYGDVASAAQEVLAEAPGAYMVVGSWTFSAASIKNKDGILKPVAGYYTEELDASGEWTNKIWHEGETEYPYNCETSPACVRLTWSVPPPGTILILR